VQHLNAELAGMQQAKMPLRCASVLLKYRMNLQSPTPAGAKHQTGRRGAKIEAAAAAT